MRNTGARVVLVYPDLLDTARNAAKQAGLAEDKVYLFSDTEHKDINETKDWRSMLGSPEEAASYKWPLLKGSEAKTQIASVNYSSGTTGLPKGVMITHSNLVANVEQNIFLNKTTDGGETLRERWIGLLPLFHAYGQWSAILMAGKTQTPVYVMKTFVYEDFLHTIQTHKITELHVAPPIMVLLGKHPATAKYDLSSVKRITCGAAPLSKSLQSECATRFKTTVKQAWGMTEVTCMGLTLPNGIKDESGSVGILLPNSQVKLLDEDGKEVATGERGEIHIRGPNVSPGYWKNENATRETRLEGDWLRTGDVAMTDERGWFWIVDRLKVFHSLRPAIHGEDEANTIQELIKVSGLQVAPAELEAVLLTHPAIADVGVVGISDSFDAQEKPRAYVQLKEDDATGAEEIQSWMQTKVAKHKYLTGGVVFIDAVPKSPAGKIQRKILREWAKQDAQVGKAKL